MVVHYQRSTHIYLPNLFELLAELPISTARRIHHACLHLGLHGASSACAAWRWHAVLC